MLSRGRRSERCLKTLLNPATRWSPAPYFVEYGNYVRNYDGVLWPWSPTQRISSPTFEKLAAIVTPKTKAVIINSPNNPRASFIRRSRSGKIAAVLEAKQKEYGTSIFIISDEPYRELAYDGVEVPYLTKFYKNTIVCYSWSKSLSLPASASGIS